MDPQPRGDPGTPDDDLSPQSFFKTFNSESDPTGTSGYEHFDLKMLQAMARQLGAATENYALKPPLTLDKTPGANGRPSPNRAEELIIYDLCFCLSYIWRRGRQSIRKYFHLRDIYVNNIEYDVGYMTHAIMVRYQNALELYQYCSNLIEASKPKAVKINALHMGQFYKSIQEDVRTVIYLCNMMHELKAKYMSSGFNRTSRFQIPTNTTSTTVTDSGELRGGHHDKKKFLKIDKSYLAQRLEQSHKLIDDALAQRKKKLQEMREYHAEHRYQGTKRTQTMRLWSPNLDYDLSGDDDDW